MSEYTAQYSSDVLAALGMMDREAYQSAMAKARAEAPVRRDAAEPENLAAWLRVMDWMKLKRLELSSATSGILATLRPVLRDLVALEIGSASELAARALPEFLLGLNKPLVELKLWNVEFESYGDIVEAIGAAGGNALRELSLAEHEETRFRWCMSDYSAERCKRWNGGYFLPRPWLNAGHLARPEQRVHPARAGR